MKRIVCKKLTFAVDLLACVLETSDQKVIYTYWVFIMALTLIFKWQSLEKSHQRIDLSDYRYSDMRGIVYKNIIVADILLAFTYHKINN